MLKNSLVSVLIACLISATSLFYVAQAASLRNAQPRLTLSMASQSRSAMQSMREFALYMGPKGLPVEAEEQARQRAMDVPFLTAGQRQLLAEDEEFPLDLRSKMPEFQAKENAGIKCRRKIDGEAGDSGFEVCTATDEAAAAPSIVIHLVCSMLIVPLLT
ncbi:uncharacterized protein LOC117897279 isoform X1 [Drosophila subobscura]|uniref:uncharacterized protein LOC117897279 isoform X1 n=2 Tax=Drosophila subobscura TaxID=7241 RepID=UPI00155A08CF|nr:uncharacterized protein LOC117897279 isoform X1 [Drosophila subobscura]